MDEVADVGASLPSFALAPALLLALMMLMALLRHTSSTAARYVLIAVWLRIALSAAHDFSFVRTPLGLSYNALASIAISLAGLFIVRRRRVLDAGLVPFYFFFAVLIVSGLVSGLYSPMLNTLVKNIYLVAIVLAVEDAIDDLGPDEFFRRFIPIFALPFGLQALSVVTGNAKASEADGSASYIGGFYHEAAFSLMLSAGILAACLLRRVGLGAKLALIVIGLAGIVLANYRTAIVSILPLIAIALFVAVPAYFVRSQRALVAAMMLFTVGAVGLVGVISDGQRFADLGVALSEGTNIIKPPETFSVEERRLMSGRPHIWSSYIYAWKDGDPRVHAIGYGPGSWPQQFVVYAHNTLVSALYETGWMGFAAVLFLWLWMIGLACFADRGPRLVMIAAHGSFVLLNMATMPMWMIEGMIFYGVLCGYTLHWFHRSRRMAYDRFAVDDHTGNSAWRSEIVPAG